MLHLLKVIWKITTQRSSSELGNSSLIVSKTLEPHTFLSLQFTFPPHIVSPSAAGISWVCTQHLHFIPHTSCALSKIQLHEATRHLAYGNNKAGERESLIIHRCCCSYCSSMLRSLIRKNIAPSCSLTVEQNTTEAKQLV